MSILWDINHAACGHDILERYEEPKPTYTTIATYMKILYEKGFVEYFKKEGQGKTQWYIAKITRQEYTRMTMQSVKKNFFDDSLKSMFSYFIKEEKLSTEEIKSVLAEAVAYCFANGMEISFTSPGWVESSFCEELGITAPACGACLSNMAVTPAGNVVSCQSWLSDGVLGNLLGDDWDSIWNSEKCVKRREYSAQMLGECPLRRKHEKAE